MCLIECNLVINILFLIVLYGKFDILCSLYMFEVFASNVWYLYIPILKSLNHVILTVALVRVPVSHSSSTIDVFSFLFNPI